MSSTDTDVLSTLLQESGVGWLLDEDRHGRLKQLADEIEEVSRSISERLGRVDVDLLGEMQSAREALRPVIQLFASPTSTEMRTMAYCVLRGMEIKEIDFSYRMKSRLLLKVVLERADGEDLTFTSTVAWDADILRHLGIATADSKPVLHGFYAFR